MTNRGAYDRGSQPTRARTWTGRMLAALDSMRVREMSVSPHKWDRPLLQRIHNAIEYVHSRRIRGMNATGRKRGRPPKKDGAP